MLRWPSWHARAFICARTSPTARRSVRAGKDEPEHGQERRPGAPWPTSFRSALTIALVLIVGVLIGFGFHNGAIPALAAIGVVLAVSFAMSWEMAWIGTGLVPIDTCHGILSSLQGGGLSRFASIGDRRTA
jgi:hypothetical protein